MTREQFNKLQPKQKAETTWTGEFMTTRTEGEIEYALYAVEVFFVEVGYNLKAGHLTNFIALEQHQFQPYLDNIDLNALLNNGQ